MGGRRHGDGLYDALKPDLKPDPIRSFRGPQRGSAPQGQPGRSGPEA
jgi:hypothetical protein